MKKIALWNFYEDFNYNNSAFDPKKFTLSNNLNYWMILLKERFAKMGVELTTPDIYPIDEYDGYIFVDYPELGVIGAEKLSWICNNKPAYLILFENPYIRPINYNTQLNKAFKKVFTWWREFQEQDSLYTLINIPQKIPHTVVEEPKEKLACMVACNKQFGSNKPNGELYSQRARIIAFFSTYYRPDFDLYGIGWGDEPSYKGYIGDKIKTISKYKFNFCLENIYGLTGYMTEKVFDAMFAGTVPIYLGEPNAKKILPRNSVVYLDDFTDLSDLAIQISTMSDKEYNERLGNIKDFVKGDAIKDYSAENFVDILIRSVLNEA